MIFSSRPSNYFDSHVAEYISYVIRQCVYSNTSLSLMGLSKYDTHNIYKFSCIEFPSNVLLKMLSTYFDAMTIDVNKEQVVITLTIDFNKGIPF